MIKVLTAEQTRRADAATISGEPVASIDLMERAARVFTAWFAAQFDPQHTVHLFCGIGNNGGDGLCAARLLADRGYRCMVYAVRYAEQTSSDFAINWHRLDRWTDIPRKDLRSADLPEMSKRSVIIDALWGSGLNRPIAGFAGELIDKLNATSLPIVAMDMPSGLFSEAPGEGPRIKATCTLSFETPKAAFLLPENAEYVGDWSFRSIGLSPAFLRDEPCSDLLLEGRDISSWLPDSERFDHKGTYGHALIIGGASGKEGAAYLAARAALRGGAGLVSLMVTSGARFNPAFPELMHLDPGHFPGTETPGVQSSDTNSSTNVDLNAFRGIALGPGWGTGTAAARQLDALLEILPDAAVFDADALNLLALEPARLLRLPAGSILTPHPGEFTRLFGNQSDGYSRWAVLRERAAALNVNILLKGAYSCLATPDGRLLFNPTGNPGMATAGSGDVLTGLIAALLARGLRPERAAAVGMYLHGLAGDLAATYWGFSGLTAPDLIETLPLALEATENGSLPPSAGI